MTLAKKYLLWILANGILCGNALSQTSHTVVQSSPDSARRDLREAALPLSDDSSFHHLAQNAEVLDLGYDRINYQNATVSVTSLSGKDFNQGPIHEPLQLIQGRVPGLHIVRPGGNPNDDFILRLRGLSTMQSGSSPLIVIDHFPGASLLGIDPQDIESIVILRDAASTALYGLRGANGVILMTTKKGVPDRPAVEYHVSIGQEDIARKMPVMSAASYRSLSGKTNFGAETDWLDQITRKAGTVVHNLSFSGGSGSTTYRASVNYRDVEGILINSGFSHLNTRVALRQAAISNRATFSMDLSRTTREREIGFPVAFKYATAMNPTMPVYDYTTDSPTAGGMYGGYAEQEIYDYYNPLSIVKQNKNDQKDMIYSGKIAGEYDFSYLVKGLSFSLSYYRQQESTVRSSYFAKTSKYGNTSSLNWGKASKRLDNNYNQLVESLLHYKRDLGALNISLTGGYSLQKFFDDGFGMEGGNFLTDAFTYNNIGAALDFDNGVGNVFSYAQSSKLEALVGSGIFSFKDTYFFSASVRNEGSSRLGANQKRAVFPAASAAVTISNLIELPVIDFLKLRMGYGISGNQPDRPYSSLAQWGELGQSYQGGVYRPTYGLIQSANPQLRWEEKKEVNIGFNITLLDSRLTASYDYFSNTADDLILSVSDYPNSPNIWGNVIQMDNRGFDFDLTFAARNSGRFYWSTGLNVAKTKTRIHDLSEGAMQFGQDGVAMIGNLETTGCGCTSFIRVKEGEPIGEIWGPLQVGLDDDGRQVFADLTGDGYGDGYQDRRVLGSSMPDFTFGFHNTIKYQNFSLTFLIRGALGHSVVNNNRLLFEGQGPFLPYNIIRTKYYLSRMNSAQFSDYYTEKAGYINFDNLQLSYDIAMNAGSSLTKLQVYFAIQNFFTLTSYTGLDPEVRYYNSPYHMKNISHIDDDNNPLTSGMESVSTYPRTRTFSLGLRLKI